MLNFQAIKNYQKALNDILSRIFKLFWIPPKKTYLNQATKKKYLLKFSYLRNPKIENVKPKKSLNHPCHLESRVRPWGYDEG